MKSDFLQLAKRFWDEGYLVIDGFFPNAEMDELNALILDHFGLDPAWEHTAEFLDKSATEVVPWFPSREGVEAFDRLGNNADFTALTTEILGTDWGEMYSMAMFSKQGTKGQAWHQDCPPEDRDRFNLNRLVYTHDIDESTGGQTMVVPGSHKQGVLPSGDPTHGFENEVTLYPKKGTLVLLHGHTWHKVTLVTGTYRVSTNYRAMPSGTPEDITDIAVYRNMRYQFSTNEVIEQRIA